MKKKIIYPLLSLLSLIPVVLYLGISYHFANQLSTNPPAARADFEERKQERFAALQLPEKLFSPVVLTNSKQQALHGWFRAGKTKRVIFIQHGYKRDRLEMLPQAKPLLEAGYGVLLTSIRAHDRNDGDVIYFGKREVEDLALFYAFLTEKKNYAPAHIGFIGNSLGATLVIAHAAKYQTPGPIVSHSAFYSLEKTVSLAIPYFTGLPAWLFATPIVFLLENRYGFTVEEINTEEWIKKVKAPLLLLQGGADVVVPKESGEKLLQAAASTEKELWYEPTFPHTTFEALAPEEYRARVVGFFKKQLP